jgi:glutathione peroxidase-family protein
MQEILFYDFAAQHNEKLFQVCNIYTGCIKKIDNFETALNFTSPFISWNFYKYLVDCLGT